MHLQAEYITLLHKKAVYLYLMEALTTISEGELLSEELPMAVRAVPLTLLDQVTSDLQAQVTKLEKEAANFVQVRKSDGSSGPKRVPRTKKASSKAGA